MTATSDLADCLMYDYPNEAARVLEILRHEQIAALLSELEPAVAARLLPEVSTPIASRALELVERDRIVPILEHLPIPVSANLLRRTPTDFQAPLLESIDQRTATRIRGLLRYPSHTVGSSMNPHVSSFSAETTVETALETLRSNRDTSLYIYVTESHHELAGVVNAGELVAADPEVPLSAVMTRQVVRLRHDDSLEIVAKHDAWSKWHSLPVVERSMLIGVLHYDSVREMSGVKGTEPELAVSLPLSLAELLWLGMVGITDGLTRVVTRSGDHDVR